MQFKNIWLCLGAALLTLFAACKKDNDNTPSGSSNWPGATVKASFSGRVLDEAGQPVEGATVRAGAASETTDENGVFIIKDQSVNSARAIVTAFKPGYWDGTRTLFVSKNSDNRLVFRLLKKKTVGSFTASSGGKLAVAGGAQLDFPAGAISKNGAAYSGTVNVAAAWLDPTDKDLFAKIPGNLRGLRTGGDEQGLATYGMVGVELTDASGQPLEVASGQKVKITMPIPAALQARAPQTIVLWHFSENEGIWKEEGTAQKVGSNYEGEVAHFSWWNCDDPFGAVKLKLCLKDADGNPLQNVVANLTSTTYGTTGGWPDANGCVEGLVPANETLELEVLVNLPCGDVVFSQNVGPFTTDTDLGDITVSSTGGSTAAYATIEGSLVNCSGSPVTSGYAILNPGGLVFPDAAGHFSQTLFYCTDNAPTSVGLKAYDAANLKESQPQSQPFGASVDFGAVTACDDLDEYIRYDLDGTGLQTLTVGVDSTFVGNTASVYAYDPITQKQIGFGFNHNQQPENDLPLLYLYVQGLEAKNNVPSFTVETDMTNYPAAVGQYLIGTFGGDFVDHLGSPHSISGTYRIKRKF